MLLIQRLTARWSARRKRNDSSPWDNPVTGRDLIQVMIDTDKAKKRRVLP